MADFQNPTSLVNQAQQLAGSAQSQLNNLTSTTLSSAESAAKGVMGDITSKLQSAGASISGAAAAAFDSLGSSIGIKTKFKDLFSVPAKLQDVRPEGVRGKVTAGSQQLQFPLDLGKYYIKFTFLSGQQQSPVFPKKFVPLVSIFLPIPSDLNERYGVRYAEKELGMLGILEESGALKGVADALGGNMTKESAKDIGQQIGKLVSAPGDASQLVVRAAAKSMGDSAAAAIDRATGSILNPYQALQFQGIDLRSHSFKFRCSPNSEAEAAALKEIIYQFKLHMLPEKKDLLFNFPDVCSIDFSSPNMPYSFKNCYLKSMSVNYAPQGTPAFFKGGKYPAEVEISLEFGEIEPITRNDVQKNGGDLSQMSGQTSIDKPVPVATEGKRNAVGSK